MLSSFEKVIIRRSLFFSFCMFKQKKTSTSVDVYGKTYFKKGFPSQPLKTPLWATQGQPQAETKKGMDILVAKFKNLGIKELLNPLISKLLLNCLTTPKVWLNGLVYELTVSVQKKHEIVGLETK